MSGINYLTNRLNTYPLEEPQENRRGNNKTHTTTKPIPNKQIHKTKIK
jgi:hypothetical protein